MGETLRGALVLGGVGYFIIGGCYFGPDVEQRPLEDLMIDEVLVTTGFGAGRAFGGPASCITGLDVELSPSEVESGFAAGGPCPIAQDGLEALLLGAASGQIEPGETDLGSGYPEYYATGSNCTLPRFSFALECEERGPLKIVVRDETEELVFDLPDIFGSRWLTVPEGTVAVPGEPLVARLESPGVPIQWQEPDILVGGDLTNELPVDSWSVSESELEVVVPLELNRSGFHELRLQGTVDRADASCSGPVTCTVSALGRVTLYADFYRAP